VDDPVCAPAGPRPTTRAASEAAAMMAYRCIFQVPLCMGCGRGVARGGPVAGWVPPYAPPAGEWSFYNLRRALSSRAMTVRWIWFVPS
jgi:hypothetical protein